ncbi:CTP--2,3-di-O-geranylgeranyl-sn-glycero-1-phosphate cytidyltransferase [Candidatus Parcubacteria bacterium]|nr:CTP--2,3-di-O-geranylgeranyl-sn-glycero-1-phosphate cytidyltransferase [Candidatus Parcubacteria bacterium]
MMQDSPTLGPKEPTPDFWSRKLLHLLAFGVLYAFWQVEATYSRQAALIGMVALVLLILLYEFARMELGWHVPFQRVLRAKERHTVAASVHLFLGMTVALAVFDPRVANAAILMAIIGDSVSAIVSYNQEGFRVPERPEKNWEAALAEFAVDLIIGFLLLPTFWLAPVMAAAATIAEMSTRYLDDNLAIPVVAGLVGQVGIALL